MFEKFSGDILRERRACMVRCRIGALAATRALMQVNACWKTLAKA
jgi:hypothetical protein